MAIDRAKAAKQAEDCLAAGRIGEAIDNFLKLLEDSPKAPNLINRIGDLYLQSGKPAEALAMFKRAAAGFGQDGFPDKAIAIYKKALRCAPDDMDLAKRLGDTYKSANKPKNAAEFHIQLSDSYLQKGLVPMALRELSEAAALEPLNIKYKTMLAELYLKEGLKERSAEIFLEVAEMMAKDGSFAEAGQILEWAETMASPAKISSARSRIDALQKHFSAEKNHPANEPETSLEGPGPAEPRAEVEPKASAPAPELQTARIAAEAKQLEGSNRAEKAIELYQSILEIDPLNSDAIESIAEIHMASGMATKVQSHYCKVAEKMSSMGDKPSAMAYLDKAEAIIPGSTRAYWLMWGLKRPSGPKPAPGQGSDAGTLYRPPGQASRRADAH